MNIRKFAEACRVSLFIFFWAVAPFSVLQAQENSQKKQASLSCCNAKETELAGGKTTCGHADACNALDWTLSRCWSNGFNALPDVCTNLQEFRSQYHKNRVQWDAMFHWLATHDLLAIPNGKHPIEGTELVVSVEDSENQPLEKRGSESHYHHIDFQYVVSGTERFALLDHASSTPKGDYKPDVMNYNYDASKARFIDSTPERFFLFFPSDWHIAKIKTDKESQRIRVIVVKLDYK